MEPDQYGRSVVLSTDGVTDTYTVDDGKGNVFSIEVQALTPVENVYSTINAMGPPPSTE